MKLICRALVLLILIILYNPAAYAKQRFQLGLTGGLSTAYLNKEASVFTLPEESLWGYHAGAKALLDFRFLQFGLGLEVGNIKGDIARYVDNGFGVYRGFTIGEDNVSVLGFYKAPHVLANVKINVGSSLYFFAGGMGGAMMGNSGITLSKYTAPFYGANLGLVINLGNNLGLEIYEGWRHTEIYRQVPLGDIEARLGRYSYSVSNYTGAVVNYFTTNVGLRIRFGSNENKWYR